MNLPKISCVTVTLGRTDHLKRSISNFQNQTYPNKELIVLSQAPPEVNGQVSDYIKSLADDRIFFTFASPTLSLGAMRNLSIELTTGEIICQWDDDDYHHPLRMATQYKSLQGRAIASFYCEHLKYFVDTGELYWVDWSIEREAFQKCVCGTVMFYKKQFHLGKNMLYPESGENSSVREDLEVVTKLQSWGETSLVHYGHHYIYVYHGNNVYWRKHHENIFQKHILSKSELLLRKDLIAETLLLTKMTDKVKVCALDGLAYELQVS